MPGIRGRSVSNRDSPTMAKRDFFNNEFSRRLREIMRVACPCDYEKIPSKCFLIVIGESPPPQQRDFTKTSLYRRFVSLSGESKFWERPFVKRGNVNAKNPGARGRGSKSPIRQEATRAAY